MNDAKRIQILMEMAKAQASINEQHERLFLAQGRAIELIVGMLNDAGVVSNLGPNRVSEIQQELHRFAGDFQEARNNLSAAHNTMMREVKKLAGIE